MLDFLQILVKIRKPEANLKEGLLESVKVAAEQAKMNAEAHAGGYRIGDSQTAIVAVQFGGRREFYETMEKLEKEQTDYRVLITSSNVKSMRIGEMKWILNNKYQTKHKWLIIDVEHKESPKTVNFMLYGGGKRHKMRREEGIGPQESAKQAAEYAGHNVQDVKPETQSSKTESTKSPLIYAIEENYSGYEGLQKVKSRRKKIYGKRGEHKEQD